MLSIPSIIMVVASEHNVFPELRAIWWSLGNMGGHLKKQVRKVVKGQNSNQNTMPNHAAGPGPWNQDSACSVPGAIWGWNTKCTPLMFFFNMSKFTRFLGPKICARRTKTDFKDRATGPHMKQRKSMSFGRIVYFLWRGGGHFPSVLINSG